MVDRNIDLDRRRVLKGAGIAGATTLASCTGATTQDKKADSITAWGWDVAAKSLEITVVGPSGCGKTTTLRCVAGLEEVTSGAIRFDFDETALYLFDAETGDALKTKTAATDVSVSEHVSAEGESA